MSKPTSLPCRLLCLAALAVPPAYATDQSEGTERFAVSAELRPQAISSCGRFAIEAQARYVPAARSSDGRFVLKSVNIPTGNCAPQPDPLFANGFESP